MASKEAGFFPPFGVGGWMVLVTSRFVFASELLKPEFAIGLPLESKPVVFRLSDCAIRSGLSHQYCPSPPSSWRLPRWSEGFTCLPNIQPSSLLATSEQVAWSACTFT